jgi:UDP-N-acetylglucosamine--N-acetylmuramyl-(pentapeptide) pyrophosphoryl-undecaprenol N-acetylglucosamine transferase
MMPEPLQIVFAGGGTAGHLFPGLAVAAELTTLADPPEIVFAGSGRAFEKMLVNEEGFKYLPLRCSPLNRGMRGMWRFVGENMAGYRDARQFLRRRTVNIVVGLGGFASVPFCRAAIRSGVPVVLLEQNVVPGKATRWLAPHADLVCTAFEEARKHLLPAIVQVTGNPLRAGFRRPMKPVNLRGSQCRGWRHRLLVVGGSGGARSINENVPKALYKLRKRLRGWQIVHQTGADDVTATQALYRKLAIAAIVVPFVQNMPSVMRRSDLAICRAGGSTLAELAATGVPAILLPYPHAADDHQRSNAEVFATAGAARIIDERKTAARLDDAVAATLSGLVVDAFSRREMSSAMMRLARPDATWRVSRMIFELARQAVGRKVA